MWVNVDVENVSNGRTKYRHCTVLCQYINMEGLTSVLGNYRPYATDFQRSHTEIEEYCVPKDAKIPGH